MIGFGEGFFLYIMFALTILMTETIAFTQLLIITFQNLFSEMQAPIKNFIQ